jgi:hypothetical protein
LLRASESLSGRKSQRRGRREREKSLTLEDESVDAEFVGLDEGH